MYWFTENYQRIQDRLKSTNDRMRLFNDRFSDRTSILCESLESTSNRIAVESETKSNHESWSPVAQLRQFILKFRSYTSPLTLQSNSNSNTISSTDFLDELNMENDTHQENPRHKHKNGSWLVTLGALAIGLRVVLFPLAFYTSRNAQKLAYVSAELTHLRAIAATAPDRTTRAAASLNLRNELLRQYGVSKLSLIPWLPIVQIPLFVSSIMAVRSICIKQKRNVFAGLYTEEELAKQSVNPLAALSSNEQIELGLTNGGLFSFTDLTSIDSSMSLPIFNTFLLLLQIERAFQPSSSSKILNHTENQQPKSGLWDIIRSDTVVDRTKVILQGSMLLLFPFYAALPSGVLFFWSCNSVLSTLQPTLMRTFIGLLPNPSAMSRRKQSQDAPETGLPIQQQLQHKMENAQEQLKHLEQLLKPISEESQGSADEKTLKKVQDIIDRERQNMRLTVPVKAKLSQGENGSSFVAIEIDPDAPLISSSNASGSQSTDSLSIFEQQQLHRLQQKVNQFTQETPSDEVVQKVNEIIKKEKKSGALGVDVYARIQQSSSNPEQKVPYIELVVRRVTYSSRRQRKSTEH